jgi:hypothetical protein
VTRGSMAASGGVALGIVALTYFLSKIEDH